jgi:hypothetical protein
MLKKLGAKICESLLSMLDFGSFLTLLLPQGYRQLLSLGVW